MNQPDSKKTVLLVDDAPANIQVVNSILKDIYKIRIATNGPKALELARWLVLRSHSQALARPWAYCLHAHAFRLGRESP